MAGNMKEIRTKHTFTTESITTDEYIKRRMGSINNGEFSSRNESERKEKLKEIIGKEINLMEL